MKNRLLEKGFRRFEPSSLDNENITDKYQKRYDDEKGKKYFITVNKWRPWVHPYTGDKFGPSYDYDIQLYKKDTRDAINVNFLSSWNIDDVEDYAEKLFNTGLFDYYEEW